MSRTTNGNLTGKAAHIDKYDFLESLQPVEKLTAREEMQILLGVKKGFLGNLVNPTKEIIEATENEIADLEAKLAYDNDWEVESDEIHDLLLKAGEIFPTQTELVNGAKLTDAHRVHIHKVWNDRYR